MNKYLKVALTLSLFTFISISLVIFVQINVYEKYTKNDTNNRLRKQLEQMLPTVKYDNNIVQSCYLYKDEVLTNLQEFKIFVAKKNSKPVGYIIESLSNQGYGGEIKLLTGIKISNEIDTVIVTKHNETPGLGDAVMQSKSDWLNQFKGSSLKNKKFAVSKDGGDFIYTTGATITPRAIINGEKNLLEFVEKNNEKFTTYPKCKLN